MARRIVSAATITPVATADTTSLVDLSYAFVLLGGSSTKINYIHEVSISGQAASSSSPTFMILSRDSTIAATLGSTTTVDATMDTATAALAAPPITGNAFTTKPQRAATLHLMNCNLNAFGGVYFWRANKIDECPRMLGNAVNVGEVSLSAFTGGTVGAIGAHMIYESL